MTNAAADDMPSLADVAEYERLRIAIARALLLARNLPTSFDSQTRALVVTKLQESEFWARELTRERDG